MGKNKKIIKPSYTPTTKSGRLVETDNKKCLISLEKVIIDNEFYGLCLNQQHTQINNQNSKKFNTALLKLFHFLCKRTWNEIYQTRRQQEHGHEHFPIQDMQVECIKTYFIDICGKSKNDKIDTFRFGSQKFRACGFRQTDTFYLVCIDYDFSLYNHGS